MRILEKELTDILKDLKENYGVCSLKAEFSAEGSTVEEIKFLKKLADNTNLYLTVKIGGCEAIKDLYDAKNISSNAIVAPMIETKYAMKKFIKSVNSVYSEEEREKIKTYINIETMTSFKNIESMVNSIEFQDLNGIILGRSDMAQSFELESDEDVNSERILNIATALSLITKDAKKELIIGGGISLSSLSFFERIPYLSKIETRKLVFDSPKTINSNCLAEGIRKAINFEILWLQNKETYGGAYTDRDRNRINTLNSRYKIWK